MTDALPVYVWLPIALVLWGYLAADALVRRRNRRRNR